MNHFANVLTFLIHPAVLSLPAVFLIVFHEVGSFNEALLWMIVTLIAVGIIGAYVLFGVKRGFFNNVDVSNRKQRVLLYPFVAGVVIFFVGCVYLLKGPPVLIFGGIFLVISLLVFDAINTKIKASVHVASITSLSIVLISLYGGWSYLALLFVPIVAWARIVERRHTLKETIAGGVGGAILTIITLIVIQYL